MAVTKTIAAAIKRTIRAQLSGLKIADIKIMEDVDFYGNDIFRIIVIYDSEIGGPDPNKAIGMVRHTRSAVGNRTNSFPLISYVSRLEA